MKAIVAILLSFVISEVELLPFVSVCPEVQPMQDFDPQKFQGVWYEIMRCSDSKTIPTKCNTETYQFNGTEVYINATFLENKTNRQLMTIGTADINPNMTSVWKYSFPSVFGYGEMVVLETDYENYAVIYTCKAFEAYTIEYGWTISRQRTMNQDIMNKLLDEYAKSGGDTSAIVYVDQSNC